MQKIGFIGTGKMATALISSIYNKKFVSGIAASGKNDDNLNYVKNKFRAKTTKNNKEAVKNSNIVFICVKPQDIDGVLHEIKNEVGNKLVVSIAAGITTAHIESVLGRKRIVRVMPNVNCLVGEMAAGFSAGRYATAKDTKTVERILSASGLAFRVDENQLDILSTISGSGPAFFAYFAKHMADAAAKKGLPREIGVKLASKTLMGTGKLLLEKNMQPDSLISMVASKKGITLAGLEVLKKSKADEIIEKMINAAYKRSRELGK